MTDDGDLSDRRPSVELPLDGSAADDVEVIRSSGAFDVGHYQVSSGLQFFAEDVAIRHYLTYGEAEGLRPNPDFDVEYYRRHNPDVVEAGVNAFAHYILYGRRERRYPSAQILADHVDEVLKSGLFDARYYQNASPSSVASGMRAVEHYLAYGSRQGLRPNPSFDGQFYEHHCHDARLSPDPPLLHYIRVGKALGLRTSYESIERAVDVVRSSSLFDEGYYISANELKGTDPPIDAAVHFVMTGADALRDPGPAFSVEYYVRRYPDLSATPENTLVHFEMHGRGEGRACKPAAASSIFTAGRKAYNPAMPVLLVVLHESSRTGAPLLGLALIREYAERYNIIVWAGREGVLSHDLEDLAFLTAYGFLSPIDCEFILRDLLLEYPLTGAIANSAETSPVHDALMANNIPTVGLIHEFADYTRPVGRMTDIISRLDRCIFPARIVAASAQKEIDFICGSIPNNLVVQAQGRLPDDLWSMKFADDDESDSHTAALRRKFVGKKIVLGAGFVQIRKGTDLFIETVRRVKDEAEARGVPSPHFLWIGDGWDPQADPHYSLWLQNSIERWDIGGDITIIQAQNTIDWAFDLADVFLLSSRLDPFPNVAVDAIAADVPVVCFDLTTGIAEFIERTGAAGTVVPYLDCVAAARAILDLLPDKGRASNARVLAEELDFPRYAGAVETELEQARALVEERLIYIDALATTGLFDQAFHTGLPSQAVEQHHALAHYVAQCTKGIYRNSPLPGFHDKRYVEAATGPVAVPLLHAQQSNPGVVPQTHSCLVVDSASRLSPSPALPVAIHAHLFYAELSVDLERALGAAGIEADLFVSCPDEMRAQEIGYHLRRYKGGKVVIRSVPNVGRDIGPFVTEFGDELLSGGYDVIGHVHGKRSVALGGGDRWREYLWNNLIDGPGVWPTIHRVFVEEPTLGLVFPEDRHVVGWNQNKPFAEDLQQRLGLPQDLPGAPIFPLGTMFWSRPGALKALLGSGLVWADYPAEPLPYDGSMLHAIERLLPTICEQSGHEWKTIFLPGSSW